MIRKRKALFEAANYSKIIEMGAPKQGESRVYWVGAHVFTGREEQARHIHRQMTQEQSSRAPLEEMIEASFYLLLTSLRRSHYGDMKRDFWKLFQLCLKKRNSFSKFFLNQAIGLLRYYKGEFAKSFYFSQRAFDCALHRKRDYFLMLSLDLMAHSQCMMESYSKGISYFEESLRFAEKIKNNQNKKVIELSIMTYQIEAGQDLIQVELQLNDWMENIRVDDYFTFTNACLLKAKIFQLKGLFGEAEKILNEIGNDVFTLNQGRQILNYNLCLSISRCVIDQPERSLSLIKTSTRLCNQGQDYYFLHRFKELESFVSRKMSKEFSAKELKKLSLLTGRKIKKRFPLSFLPEDFVLSLIRKERSYPISFELLNDLNSRGLLGLLKLAEIYKSKDEFVDFTLSGRRILFYMEDNFTWVEGLSSMQWELLQLLLTQENWTRKDLFEAFWQVPYDSFVHDNKLYVTLKRLREKLGVAANVVKLDRGFIRCRSLKVWSKSQDVLKKKKLSRHYNDYLEEGLNPRQLQLLRETSSGSIVTPREYSEKFSISRNTVTGDLKELVRKGYLKKFGKNKGTFYCRD
ncbi:MAG: hypothetical protein CME63_12310 [Halobacteriovoraceae bacterium]|nr:hypothetical protein [Halobacteriovoraceae bacterium]